MGLQKDDIEKGLRAVLSRKGMKDEELNDELKHHMEFLTSNYNGFRFTPTAKEGVFTTNLVLEYMEVRHIHTNLNSLEPSSRGAPSSYQETL